MKQVSENEKQFLEKIGLVELLLYVCSDNLSEFKWNHLKTKWEDKGFEKILILRNKTNIFLFKAQDNISYIYLLVAADQEKFLPEENVIENLLKDFEIDPVMVWRNEFLFDKQNKDKVLNTITKYTILGAHIVIIQKKLKELGYSDDEQENIFAMHPLYANTNLLVAAYPTRLQFLDKKKLRDFDKVKKEWTQSNPNYR